MSRGRAAFVASIALIASPVASESYRDLVEAYVRGDRTAVDRVAARTPSDLRTDLRWLQEKQACGRCGERELADRFPFLGAALLHTERAFLEYEARDENALRLHLDFARALLESAPPRVRVFERRWFAAVGLQFLLHFETGQALRYFSEGVSRFPDDASLHVGRGATLEVEARMTPPPDVVHSESEQNKRVTLENRAFRGQRFTAAAAAYRRAIQADPDSAEARLRHGRVLIDLGRREEAQRDLDWVIAHVPGGDLHSLACLFRGLVEAESERWPAAVALYREALRTGPPGARTATVALAHALDRGGDHSGAQAMIDALLARPGLRDPFDVYRFGPARQRESLLDELRAAAAAPPP